jgi:dihydropyrimidinase
MTTLIKNGTIITSTDMYKADILVKNGIVSEIGREISKIASEIIDASDKWVLPGGVDMHTRFDTQVDGMTTVDDFETGTAAAAAGGTTTVVDFVNPAPGSSLAQAVEAWKVKAEQRAVVDYGFHIGLSELNDGNLSEIPSMADAGVTSFQVSLEGIGEHRINDGAVLEFLQRATAAGALACVHAENGDLIDLLWRRLSAEGKTSAKHLPALRPPEVEAEAVGRVIALADFTRAPICLTSLSSAHALEKVKAARDRGQTVYAESCPQYLLLNSDRYEDSEAVKYYVTPPLRPAWHQDVLWRGIRSGDIQLIGSGHAAFNFAGQKDLGKDSVVLAPRGFSGVQERLCAIASEAVQGGRISMNRAVDLLCTMPAKLFGLFPRKGTIAVGSDADLVIFDPRTDQILSKALSLSRVDYCAYEGMRVHGYPWLVVQRGRIIAREGKVMGRPGGGEFLPRARTSML